MFYLRVSEAEGRLSLSATAHGRCACEGLTRVTTRQELNEKNRGCRGLEAAGGGRQGQRESRRGSALLRPKTIEMECEINSARRRRRGASERR